MEENIRIVNYSKREYDFENVAVIYSSKEYDRFTTYCSNREPDHYERIKANILDKGYICNPILVTESLTDDKMVIIDGNNRFHTLKDLNIPVSFVVLDNACETDMATLNVVSKNWTQVNYVNFYSSRGYGEYIKFANMMNKYPDYGVNIMSKILTLNLGNCHGEKDLNTARYKTLERGLFKIMDIDKSKEILDFCEKVKVIGTKDKVYNRQYFVYALIKLFRLDVFDPIKMLEKMEKYKAKIINQLSVNDYVKMLEEVYNMNRKIAYIHFDV